MGREEDALIAEKLFGCRWFYFKGTNGVQATLVSAGDYTNMERLFGESLPPSDCDVRDSTLTRAYTSNPSADYQVLQRIRETFDEPQCNEFIEELDEILEQRANAFEKFQKRGAFARFDLRALMYEPGDYARAYLKWRKVYAKEQATAT